MWKMDKVKLHKMILYAALSCHLYSVLCHFFSDFQLETELDNFVKLLLPCLSCSLTAIMFPRILLYEKGIYMSYG